MDPQRDLPCLGMHSGNVSGCREMSRTDESGQSMYYFDVVGSKLARPGTGWIWCSFWQNTSKYLGPSRCRLMSSKDEQLNEIGNGESTDELLVGIDGAANTTDSKNTYTYIYIHT